jgi:hypothetical protein
MPVCSTASLGALSLAGCARSSGCAQGLGQAGRYDAQFCADFRSRSADWQATFPPEAYYACYGGGAPAPAGAPVPAGNGNGGTAVEDVLVALFGAVPGTITAIRGDRPPGYFPPPPPPRRAGAGMFGLLAVGVVVWMLAAGRDRD